MAVTLADLIAEVEDFLSAHGADRDKETALTSALTDSATTFTVDEPALIDRGLVEIDYELMAVKSKNTGTSTVTLHSWGRGERGTTAAAHSIGARVAINPRFPRSRIRTEINTAIANLYPELFAVGTSTSNTYSPTTLTYPLPAEAERILAVQVDTIGPSGQWLRADTYRFNYNANTTDYATGKTLDLFGCFTSGRTVQVTYAKQFGSLAADSDDLATAGLDESWRDLVVLQVVSKLVLALDTARLQLGSVEQQQRAGESGPGLGTSISRQYRALYRERLEQERALQQQRYPARQVMGG